MKFLLLIALGLGASLAVQTPVLKNFVASSTKFTAEVYRELLKTKNANFLASPLSAKAILALVHRGAGGKTAQQLAQALHLPNNKIIIRQTFQEVMPRLQGYDKCNISTASEIYIKGDCEIKNDFKNAAFAFKTNIQKIDFKKRNESLSELNSWFAEKTYNKIQNLLVEADLSGNTDVVLVNALYFKGQWLKHFDWYATTRLPFHISNSKQVQVEMMRVTDYFNFYEDHALKAKFLELPYNGDDISMHFVLPNDKEGLPALEAKIADVLEAPKYNSEKVRVAIPKFRMESTIEFKPILQTLGVLEAFKDSADFSGIVAKNGSFKIGKVLQKLFFEADERGKMEALSSGMFYGYHTSRHTTRYQPQKFIADRPFIYYLKNSVGIIFIGRYIQN